VVSNADTTTVVTSSQNPSVFGQSGEPSPRLSPVLAPGAGTPTGTVTFLVWRQFHRHWTLSGGVANIHPSALVAGSHTLTTSYAGDGSFNGSTGSLTGNPQVVSKSDTTTGVTSSVNPSVFGPVSDYTATVSPVGARSRNAHGNV